MRTRHENGSGDYDSDMLGSIIETAPDAILTIDVKGTVLSFSPAAEKIFGYAPDEVIGNNVKVNSYSHVEGSILFDGVDIGRHAKVRNAIIDKRVSIPAHDVIGYDADDDRARGFTVTENGVVVIASGDNVVRATPHETATV